MEHVDEGTVHAWLDGALPPDEGARIEAHIASCKACSALVAEGRGLIAASSRILSALDDVPAGVAPAVAARAGLGAAENRAQAANASGEAASTPVSHLPSPVSGAKRAWWQRPQFAAAAAMAFIAAGAMVVVRINTSRTVADFAATAAEQGGASDSIAPAPPAAAQDFSRGASQPLAATPTPADKRVEPRRLSTTPNADAPAANLNATARAAAKQLAEKTLAPSPALAPPEAARAVADAARAAAASRAELSSSKASDSAQSATRDSVRERSARAQAISPSLSAERITGREAKRLQGEREVQLGQVVARGAASQMPAAPGGPRRQDAIANNVAGCYIVESGNEVANAPIVGRVVLDTTAAAEWAGRPAWRVTVLSPATLRPVDFRWSLGTEGQVILVELRDGRHYSWTLDVPGAPRAAAGIPVTRVDCPAR